MPGLSQTQIFFDDDIRLWPIHTIPRVPTKKNSVDCGMYICKYMEAVIRLQLVIWADLTNWQ
ncbi:hypothetical protein IEQ34_022812 [Dendrobium chrysotoxum]|uniref:Ubiquitin-like protease family profile domain-containing protein n=1 Tax=Dendrobium chrysotoxum TaxID=161865 RepID=A0AAV7G0I2_DENCH|nr:hypothetical protein IEQ34_022812 [Dendrobium chrysotoxum]